MSAPIDFYGISALIASVTAAITSIGGLVLTSIAVTRQVQATKTLHEVKSLVNGLGDKREVAALKEGRIQGQDEERANPTIATHRVDE